MKIKKINEDEYAGFNQLSRLYGTIFYTTGWIKLFDNKIQCYGIYNKGNELIGGFILYKEKKFGFTLYCNPPFTPTIGPFLKIDAQNSVSLMSTWKEVLSIMADFIGNLPYSVVTFALNNNIIDMQPFIWNNFKVVPKYTYLIDLSLSLENIWKNMSSVRKRNINRAKKDGLQARKTTDYKLVKDLVKKTLNRQNVKINEIYLDKILFEFANDENSFSFITFNNDTPIAASFFIYDKKTIYYSLGGYDENCKHHGAGALSLWQAIELAKSMELQYFDFEGSMVPEIEKYFRGFGGQLTPFYTINKAKLPIEILLKFYRRNLF